MRGRKGNARDMKCYDDEIRTPWRKILALWFSHKMKHAYSLLKFVFPTMRRILNSSSPHDRRRSWGYWDLHFFGTQFLLLQWVSFFHIGPFQLLIDFITSRPCNIQNHILLKYIYVCVEILSTASASLGAPHLWINTTFWLKHDVGNLGSCSVCMWGLAGSTYVEDSSLAQLPIFKMKYTSLLFYEIFSNQSGFLYLFYFFFSVVFLELWRISDWVFPVLYSDIEIWFTLCSNFFFFFFNYIFA